MTTPVANGFGSRRLSKLITLDAFPKVSHELMTSTESGGLLSLVVWAIFAYLILSEVWAWRTVQHKYDFTIDHNRAHEMEVNIDITIAMDCKYLRGDVLDMSGASLPVSARLTPNPVKFTDREVEDLASHFKKNLKAAERNVLNVHKMLKNIQNRGAKNFGGFGGTNDACRFHGSFPVNKLKGMFHFTALGYGYGSFVSTPLNEVNFTHRIDQVSFGKSYPGLVNPLDGTLARGESHLDNFQYFVGLVPTTYIDRLTWVMSKVIYTTQYAVTEFNHTINPEKPDALPGIFVQYDIEPISVKITATRIGTIQFITRLCGIVGGVFVVFGMLLRLWHGILNVVNGQSRNYSPL